MPQLTSSLSWSGLICSCILVRHFALNTLTCYLTAIELSNCGEVPSPGRENPSGLFNGESLTVQPISDLDLFFERLYSYYIDKGLWCIIRGLKNAKCGMDVVESGTKPCDLVKEVIHEHPLFFAQLKDTLDSRHFYYNSLHVTDNEILTMPWETVLEKVVQLQSSQRLCMVKDLSAHDIVMHLMRKENYLIRMVNKGLLSFPISHWIPGAAPVVKSAPHGTQHHHLVLTKTLEWTLNCCILQSMFDWYAILPRYSLIKLYSFRLTNIYLYILKY
ncbi:BnaC04g13500D [Brassica napus]|uniref:Autophagy-related protein 9 n=1 Tax=Brassica napus TaxID=3708 RepID=A0A078GDW9_BRANA|nr:unnamed protein product [Brassica napus]CDY24745.1 BnaC04g13500D [Brassica napus]